MACIILFVAVLLWLHSGHHQGGAVWCLGP